MKLKATALTGLTLGALALGAVPAAAATSGEGWTAIPGGTSAPASGCYVHVLNVTKQGPGGWYKAKITKACKRGSVQAEIECRDIRNHNFYAYGKVVYRKGAVSYKKCGITLQIKEDWVIIGGHKHEVWPRQTVASLPHI